MSTCVSDCVPVYVYVCTRVYVCLTVCACICIFVCACLCVCVWAVLVCTCLCMRLFCVFVSQCRYWTVPLSSLLGGREHLWESWGHETGDGFMLSPHFNNLWFLSSSPTFPAFPNLLLTCRSLSLFHADLECWFFFQSYLSFSLSPIFIYLTYMPPLYFPTIFSLSSPPYFCDWLVVKAVFLCFSSRTDVSTGFRLHGEPLCCVCMCVFV